VSDTIAISRFKPVRPTTRRGAEQRPAKPRVTDDAVGDQLEPHRPSAGRTISCNDDETNAAIERARRVRPHRDRQHSATRWRSELRSVFIGLLPVGELRGLQRGYMAA